MEHAVIFVCMLMVLQTVFYLQHDFYNIIFQIKHKLYMHIYLQCHSSSAQLKHFVCATGRIQS